MGKNPPANAGGAGDPGSIPGLGSFLWRRKWQPTPVFLPGESHGQRNLADYRPRGRKELDRTEPSRAGLVALWPVGPSGTFRDLPGPGIEPMSPALAGRLFTAEPPGSWSSRFLEFLGDT